MTGPDVAGHDLPAVAAPHWDDVEIGLVLPPLVVAVRRADLVRYAGASGDFNPIHWDERFAREVGLPDVIAHGMFTMAQAGRLVTRWAGHPAAVVELGVRFTRPVVVPPDAAALLEITGVVKEKRDGRRVRVDLTATAAGVTVLGQARAIVAL